MIKQLVELTLALFLLLIFQSTALASHLFLPIALEEQEDVSSTKFDGEIRNQFAAINVNFARSIFSKSSPA